MPLGRIDTVTPTAKLRTTDAPKGYARFSSILTPGSSIPIGTPIGLLLALTYASVVNTSPVFTGERPTAQIRTTD